MSAATISGETKFEKAAHVVVRAQRDEFLFYNSRTDELHLIPPTGEFVYGLCDGVKTVAEIIRAIAASVNAEELRVTERVTGFLQALENRGLVELVDV